MSRSEMFERTRPNGEVVVVTRDIDTGEQTVAPKGATNTPKAGGDPVEPRGNASRDEWAAWADHLEVEYPEDAKRDDIKALIAAESGEGQD